MVKLYFRLSEIDYINIVWWTQCVLRTTSAGVMQAYTHSMVIIDFEQFAVIYDIVQIVSAFFSKYSISLNNVSTTIESRSFIQLFLQREMHVVAAKIHRRSEWKLIKYTKSKKLIKEGIFALNNSCTTRKWSERT